MGRFSPDGPNDMDLFFLADRNERLDKPKAQLMTVTPILIEPSFYRTKMPENFAIACIVII